jgi:AcrR family transcriptional regulator
LHPSVRDDWPPAKQQIVLAAERLFARDGIAGASLRQISAEAQNGNNSAVQYYFGSRAQLVQAIYEYRLVGLHARRQALVAERRPDSLFSWVECHVQTLMEQAEQPGSHYLGFLAALSRHAVVANEPELFRLPERVRAEVEHFHNRLRGLVPQLPEPLRSHRIQQAQFFMVDAGALREGMREAGRARLPLDSATGDLVEAMVGFLRAPAREASNNGRRVRSAEFFPLLL